MTVDSTPRLVTDELRELLRLAREADSIELKLTLPELAYRSTAAALGVDPLEAQIRQVFFFDTPDLRLNEAGVVARARRIQGRESDSTVKLRPVVPDQLPAGVRKSENFVVEIDAMPGGYVCSGSMKGKLAPTAVRASVSGDKPLRRLFSKEQREFFTAHAPEGLGLDDLSILGPVLVLKLKMKPDLFSRRLVGEMWIYPDGTRVVELSTKCLPGEALDVADEARTFLKAKGIELTGSQQTKTKTALSFYSAELQAQQQVTGRLAAWEGHEIQKHKWDGRVSSVGEARLVAAPRDAVAWYVAPRSVRLLPSKSSSVRVTSHELWVAPPANGGCCVPRARAMVTSRRTCSTPRHRSSRPSADVIRWIDLDLDFEVTDGVVASRTRPSSTLTPARCRTRTTSFGVPGRGSPRSPPATPPASGRSTAGWRSASPPRSPPKADPRRSPDCLVAVRTLASGNRPRNRRPPRSDGVRRTLEGSGRQRAAGPSP